MGRGNVESSSLINWPQLSAAICSLAPRWPSKMVGEPFLIRKVNSFNWVSEESTRRLDALLWGRVGCRAFNSSHSSGCFKMEGYCFHELFALLTLGWPTFLPVLFRAGVKLRATIFKLKYSHWLMADVRSFVKRTVGLRYKTWPSFQIPATALITFKCVYNTYSTRLLLIYSLLFRAI